LSGNNFEFYVALMSTSFLSEIYMISVSVQKSTSWSHCTDCNTIQNLWLPFVQSHPVMDKTL